MDHEQLELLEPGDTGPPRCRDCKRPARRHRKRSTYYAYCEGKKCGTRGAKRDRICRICNEPFALGAPGAGTKYCSTRCKVLGYHPGGRARDVIRCSWCDAPSPGITRRWAKTSVWSYICNPCIAPIKHVIGALKRHHVSEERARKLITDPGCDVCGIDLLERVATPTGMRARLTVDHDHACCPSPAQTCGSCVRGLLCGHCNAAAGMLRDSPDSARSLAVYLDTWLSSAGG